jgi:hypothetical protein
MEASQLGTNSTASPLIFGTLCGPELVKRLTEQLLNKDRFLCPWIIWLHAVMDQLMTLR